MIVVIDKMLIHKLGIDEENTFLQQELTEDGTGILMKVKNLNFRAAMTQLGSSNNNCIDPLPPTTITESD
jgi:hypothetical protein